MVTFGRTFLEMHNQLERGSAISVMFRNVTSDVTVRTQISASKLQAITIYVGLPHRAEPLQANMAKPLAKQRKMGFAVYSSGPVA